MRRTDYLLSIISGFLKASDEELATLENYFQERIEMHEMAKPGTVSLGGREDNGKESSFSKWISSVREHNVKRVKLGFIQQDIKGISPHISAGFAGTQDLILQVTTSKSILTYFIKTIYSPQYQITPEDFVRFVNSQKEKEKLWERIAELVKESNELNNREVPPADKIKEYILNLTNETGDIDFHISQLLPEIQVESKILGSATIIPAGLEHLFEKSNYPFDDFDSDYEYVYFYPVKEINGNELLELTSAQSFSDKIWKEVEQEFQQDPDIPSTSATEWPELLTKLDHESIQTVTNAVCRIICRLCEEKKLKPITPDHLKDSFGPDELENKRAQARSHLNKDQWLLTPNQHPWELYFLELIPGAGEIESGDFNKMKQRFSKSLQKATAFATHIQSPFAEAFLLGDYLLDEAIPVGDFDEAHLNLLLDDLKINQFSEMALDNFQRSFSYSEDFKKLNWSSEKMVAMMAVSIADVFGGMGSWNDQYMDNEEDQITYEKVSSELFESMRNFTAAVLPE